jgi:hypothetical protein
VGCNRPYNDTYRSCLRKVVNGKVVKAKEFFAGVTLKDGVIAKVE